MEEIWFIASRIADEDPSEPNKRLKLKDPSLNLILEFEDLLFQRVTKCNIHLPLGFGMIHQGLV